MGLSILLSLRFPVFCSLLLNPLDFHFSLFAFVACHAFAIPNKFLVTLHDLSLTRVLDNVPEAVYRIGRE